MDFYTSRIKAVIFILVIVIVIYFTNKNILIHPFIITFLLIIIYKLIIKRGHYKIVEDTLTIALSKKQRIIKINDLKEIIIIDNYTPSSKFSGGIGKNYYLVTKNDKIPISKGYKNNNSQDLISYLNETYNIKIVKTVNISNHME